MQDLKVETFDNIYHNEITSDAQDIEMGQELLDSTNPGAGVLRQSQSPTHSDKVVTDDLKQQPDTDTNAVAVENQD